ncbi:MAG: arginine--tRNA ligase [Planctomycetaceae bacterium]|nr:arginine--tRNA ligase [Planctomycetaceae bacterium]
MNLLEELKNRFRPALATLTDAPEAFVEMVRPSGDVRHGDYQANCAMPLGGQLKQPPRQVAEAIVQALDVNDMCHEPEIAGPGFINLRLKDEWLQEQTARLVSDERLGVEPVAEPQTVVVDFSAPNVAKPMHVGHLRSTVIGAALVRMLRFAGHKVISDNHIGDWGTQFGMIIYGWNNFRDEEVYERDPVGELARLYRLVNQLCDYHAATTEQPSVEERLNEAERLLEEAKDQDPPEDKSAAKRHKKELKKLQSRVEELTARLDSLNKQKSQIEQDEILHPLAEAHPDIVRLSREETAKLHAGDETNLALWQRFLPECLAALQKVYDQLGTEFDLSLGESHYQPMLASTVADLEEKGLAVESDGAMCVFLEGNEAPFIVRKRDGAFTYATTDLATIRYRVEELKADRILYVVDARQGEHFRLLFGTAARWGFTDLDLQHISFGTVLGPDNRPFKTRAGDTVGLESLLEEAVRRARKIVNENDDSRTDEAGQPAPEMDETTRADVARVVGIGGIKYADLHHNRESDYVFSWDKMLARTGDTATYIQYSYARSSGIFRQCEVDPQSLRDNPGKGVILSTPEERALALELLQFPEQLAAALADYRPNVLTACLFSLANTFSSFYEKCHVRREEDIDLRTSRLLLCDLTARVLATGLDLLGIRTVSQM